MKETNIAAIKKRANTVHDIIEVVYRIGIILVILGVGALAFSFFASPERFTAVKDNLGWSFHYKLTDNSSFFIGVPFKILQSLESNMFSAKYAAMTCLFSLLIHLSLILYGIKQVKNILKSIKDINPFTMNNVKSLKNLALSIMIYSVVLDMLTSILFSAFVTKIFLLNLTNLHLNGLFIGLLIFVIADIFQYGVFLENEFDTTL